MKSFLSVALACGVGMAGVPFAHGQEAPPPNGTGLVPPEPSEVTTTTTTRSDRRPDPVEVAADALVVRPVGLAATAIGAAIFVVALPFAAITGDIDGTARALVDTPARYTFKRKLGDFGDAGL